MTAAKLTAVVMDESCAVSHLDSRDTAARRRMMMPATAVRDVADIFRILGDPTRVRILDALSGGALCVCDIAALAAISESAVSHQLRLLRTLRLVKSTRAGRLVFYELEDQHIIELLRQAHTHAEERA